MVTDKPVFLTPVSGFLGTDLAGPSPSDSSSDVEISELDDVGLQVALDDLLRLDFSHAVALSVEELESLSEEDEEDDLFLDLVFITAFPFFLFKGGGEEPDDSDDADGGGFLRRLTGAGRSQLEELSVDNKSFSTFCFLTLLPLRGGGDTFPILK